MEPWRTVWRTGVAPVLSDAGLAALERALVTADARLVQGYVFRTEDGDSRAPLVGACAIGCAAWLGDGIDAAADVGLYFDCLAYECDRRMRQGASLNWFTSWFDHTPLVEVRRKLLPEVQRERARRARAEEAGEDGPVVVLIAE
jgi:hypothetical protein